MFHWIHWFVVNGKFSFQEMYDLWIHRLMLFTDFLLYLNGFNAKFQGCDKTIDVMFDNVKAFEIKVKTLFGNNTISTCFFYTQKHGILTLVRNQTFRAFNCNIPAPLLVLITETVHFYTDFTSWLLKQIWLFPYLYGFCNPVRIHGMKVNDMITQHSLNDLLQSCDLKKLQSS